MRILILIFLISLFQMNVSNFDIQGHRGCRGLMPENTIPAFEKAIDLGVNTLEMDVVVSKDHQILVSHDPFFNPITTTKPDGSFFTKESDSNLYLLNYEEIKRYDVGSRGNPNFPEQQKIKTHKPLLTDVIKAVKSKLGSNGSINYNIEIKSLPDHYNKSQPEVKVFCDLFLKTIKNKIRQDKLTIQSFDFNVLKYLYQLKKGNAALKFKISALIEPEDNNDIAYNIEKLGFKPDIWSPYFKTLDLQKVEKLHKLSIKVIPWTVNEIEDIAWVKKLGTDGLISDYPDRVKQTKPL